jgi:predicted DNA-binding transcriptional regulator YafY
MRRTDRLFDLVQLFSRRRLLTGAAIADALGVSLRTVYRDIDTLVASGVPIEGERGVGYLLREPYFLPPLTLNPIEIEALHLGMALVRRSGDAALAEAADHLERKVDAVLPSDRPRSGHRWSVAVHLPSRLPGERRNIATLRAAIARREVIAINYQALDGGLSARAIRPLELEFWGRVWTVTAWCEWRADFRVFRVERITHCEPTGRLFEAERGKRLIDYLQQQEHHHVDFAQP